jgi:deoxycytidylate deaminase
MKEKFIKKYMRLARQIGIDNNPCLSRQIGAVIIDPGTNRIQGMGYNGPPTGTPHCNSLHYLKRYFWPQLTEKEKESFRLEWGKKEILDSQIQDWFANKYANGSICPRRFVGAKSGERLELCSCVHCEVNTIINSEHTHGNVMLMWCGVSCWDCSKVIINAGIKEIHCLKWGKDYSLMSRQLLKDGGVKIFEYDEKEILNQTK